MYLFYKNLIFQIVGKQYLSLVGVVFIEKFIDYKEMKISDKNQSTNMLLSGTSVTLGIRILSMSDLCLSSIM